MKRLAPLFLACGLLAGPAAQAALNVGAPAPDFSAQASLGGNVFTFKLAEALKKGPVVLYFYPAAFTAGCTIEAHDFAEATDEYKSLGATVIGVSADDIDTLNKFSVSECRSKFAVAADGDRPTAQFGPAQQLDRRVERVHVEVGDAAEGGGRHAASVGRRTRKCPAEGVLGGGAPRGMGGQLRSCPPLSVCDGHLLLDLAALPTQAPWREAAVAHQAVCTVSNATDQAVGVLGAVK